MYRRLFAMLIVLISPIAFAQPAAALTYYGTCAAGSPPQNNTHKYITTNSGISVVKAWATIPSLHSLHQCSPGSTGLTFVRPVNVQGGAFVQIGLVRGGTGTEQFKYTTSDTSGGTMDGTIAEPITFGHSYTFTIEKIGSSWGYMVRDNNTTLATENFGSRSVASLTGPFWAGFEVYNDGDQMSGAGSGNTMRIQDIFWQTAGGSTIGFPSSTLVSTCGVTPGCSIKSWWRTLQGVDANGRRFIESWTDAH